MSAFDDDSKEIPIKIGIVGDTETGKTSLMIKYVENKFDEDYIMTIGKKYLLYEILNSK
jgi:GTP-binding protein of the ras superfamily involved in termination of M-phase